MVLKVHVYHDVAKGYKGTFCIEFAIIPDRISYIYTYVVTVNGLLCYVACG